MGKRFIYFLHEVSSLSKCMTLVAARKRPVVLSFYVREGDIPGNRRREDEVNALRAEMRTLEQAIDESDFNPKLNADLEDNRRTIQTIEHTVHQETVLLGSYAKQWRAPNALKRYEHALTFLMMPLDIENTDQANFIAAQYGVTRVPCLCGITLTGVVSRSERRLNPAEFTEWMDNLLEKCGVKL